MDPSDIRTYDYDLPEELVADRPAEHRPRSRLLAADCSTQRFEDRRFEELPNLLQAGDLLVFNDTRVVPARVHTRKQTGGKVELFVTDVLGGGGADRWSVQPDDGVLRLRCMTRSSKRLRPGQIVSDSDGRDFEIVTWDAGIAEVHVETDRSAAELLEAAGETPLPPYIVKRRSALGRDATTEADRERYQTVYADKPGAVAAPTAGLHFDAELLDQIRQRGVELQYVTLHVGPGTFRPVTSESLDDHEMHTEQYVIGPEIAGAVRRAHERGGRVIAVGTTTVRTLEAEALRERPLEPGVRDTDLFIKPGFEFRLVDAMITNFHLPRSTLLALVYAFGGIDFVRELYEEAIRRRFRFYSYGDAMFLWRSNE